MLKLYYAVAKISIAINMAICFGSIVYGLLIGDSLPYGWNGSRTSFFLSFMVVGLLPVSTVYMSNRFDLLSMSDGYSELSNFIWLTLGASLSLLIIYAFVFKPW
jgi:hypothetical protein